MAEADERKSQSDDGPTSSEDDRASEYTFEEEEGEDFVIEEEDEQPKDTIKKLRQNLKECTAKKQEYLDGWQRAKADMTNSKKEFAKERGRMKQRVTQEVIADILPVLDSFDMAFSNEETWNKVDKQWRSGVEHIYNQLQSVLKNHGVEVIAPEVGDKFDPQQHTSVDTEITDEEDKIDTVATCEKTGYRLEDRIIRSANVVVYRGE